MLAELFVCERESPEFNVAAVATAFASADVTSDVTSALDVFPTDIVSEEKNGLSIGVLEANS